MHKKCLWHKNVLGFNLIQLVIVVAVLAVITAVVFLNEDPLARVGKARDAKRLQEVQSIVKAIELYGVDQHSLPTDFTSTNISLGEILVLCSASGTAVCAGVARECLVVSDPEFLKYLNALPVDPEKTDTTDTGYYITRTASNALEVGACTTYDADLDIAVVAKATLPASVSSCGDGFVEGAEVCDDGNNIKEGCGDRVIQVGTYCKNDCSASIVLNEVCEYNTWTQDCNDGATWYTISDYGQGEGCNQTCTQSYNECIPDMGNP